MAGGCGRKLDFDSLSQLLSGVPLLGRDSGLPLAKLYPDAYEVPLDPSTRSVTASVDLLYAFGDDYRLFGEIVVVHALSDIYATLARPRFAMLALGITRPDLAAGRGGLVVEGVAGALRREETLFAGGHTVIAEEVFAGISVVGEPSGSEVTGVPQPEDEVLLSKPLGVGLALTALHLGLASVRDLTAAYEIMVRSNARAAGVLAAVSVAVPGSVHAVTDVSGFGFLGAIRHLASSCRVVVRLGAIPTIPGTDEWIRAQAVSGLADANVARSEDFTAYQVKGLSGSPRAVLNDPQTSGGLVAFVAPEIADRLEDSGEYVRVGFVDSTCDGTAVEVRD